MTTGRGRWNLAGHHLHGTQTVRAVIQITRASTGGWAANMFLGNSNPAPLNTVTVDESTVDLIGNLGRYYGHLSADGTFLRGLWLRGNPRPLNPPITLELKRATEQDELVTASRPQSSHHALYHRPRMRA